MLMTNSMIDKRSLAMHEPRWLRTLRKEAWQKFQDVPPLNFKKTKTPVFDIDALIPCADDSSGKYAEQTPGAAPSGKAGEIALEDGKVVRLTLQKELAAQGVIFSDLRTAIVERADLLEPYFHQQRKDDHKLDFLNDALFQNGFFLYVPEKIEIEEPFEISLMDRGPTAPTILKNIMILDRGALAQVEEVSSSVYADTHIWTEAEANLLFQVLWNGISGTPDLSSFHEYAKRASRIHSMFLAHHLSKGTMSIHGNLLEEESTIEHNGIVMGSDTDQLKLSANMRHFARNSHGLQTFKAALQGKSYAYLDGRITLAPEANQSSSRLQEQVMLLSPEARSDALPGLQIEASRVQVSHSAAVSKADPEQIFYLMSRGLSEPETIALLVQGFFDDILKKSRSQSWQEKAKSIIHQSLSTIP